MTLLQLVAATAFAIDVFPSHGHVRAIRFDESAAVIDTAGGSFRLPGFEALPQAARWGGCSYEPAEEGLRRRCGGNETLVSVGGFPATAVAAYEGELFVGTFGGGLRRLNGGRVGGVPDTVTALAATRRGMLCGTEAGLFRVGAGAAERLDPPSLPEPNVSALAAGGGTLWVGSFDRGLSALTASGWRHWTTADGLPSDWIDDLAWDGEKLWGATEKGVFWIVDGRVERPRSGILSAPSSAVHVRGVNVYVAQTKRVVVVSPERTWTEAMPEAHPQRVWVDRNGLWVAGLDGLYRLRGGEVARYGAIDGALPSNWVTAVASWQGGLLVGTYDGGLFQLDADGGSRPVLDHAWVNLGALAASGSRVAVGEMDGGLWLHDGGAWRRLKRDDGLPSDDVTAVLFEGDQLWVGTRQGLARIPLAPSEARSAVSALYLSKAVADRSGQRLAGVSSE